MEKKFTIGMPVGKSGGFGTVYECIVNDDNKNFAIKFLNDDKNEDENAIIRFQKEILFVTKLDHPNIIKIISHGMYEGKIYYIMNRYKKSLESVILGNATNFSQQYKILTQIIDGVEYLHAQGILHRDLKPGNILYNNDDDIVITDFGISRDINADSTRITHTHGMGTFRYSSPEQLSNARDVDERTDIYSLGMIIDDLNRILTDEYINSVILDSLKYIVDRCTKQNKEDRYKTVAEIKEAIKTIYSVYLGSYINSSLEYDIDSLLVRYQSIEYIKGIANKLILVEDISLIEKFLNNITDNEYIDLSQSDNEVMGTLIKKLCGWYINNEWPYSYIDIITDLCRRMYMLSFDSEVESILLHCIIYLSVTHNRFYAMEVAKELLINSSYNLVLNLKVNDLISNNNRLLEFLRSIDGISIAYSQL